jgi:ElaB/YqjD/DUF883 family membrane-anchored ribosome-binding protein
MIKNIGRTRDGVDSLIDRTHDVVVGAADRAERGLASAAGQVADKAHLAADYVRDGAEAATRSAHRRVEGAADVVDRGYTRARTDLARATDYLAANPGKALLFAAAAGFLVGVLMGRRRSPV